MAFHTLSEGNCVILRWVVGTVSYVIAFSSAYNGWFIYSLTLYSFWYVLLIFYYKNYHSDMYHYIKPTSYIKIHKEWEFYIVWIATKLTFLTHLHCVQNVSNQVLMGVTLAQMGIWNILNFIIMSPYFPKLPDIN